MLSLVWQTRLWCCVFVKLNKCNFLKTLLAYISCSIRGGTLQLTPLHRKCFLGKGILQISANCSRLKGAWCSSPHNPISLTVVLSHVQLGPSGMSTSHPHGWASSQCMRESPSAQLCAAGKLKNRQHLAEGWRLQQSFHPVFEDPWTSELPNRVSTVEACQV